jgi:Transcription factor WhiB
MTNTATMALTRALITMAQRNERPRCSDPVDHERWTSEDAADREIAAACCIGCPVISECREAAIANDERWGVWGAKDLSRRPGRKKAAA